MGGRQKGGVKQCLTDALNKRFVFAALAPCLECWREGPGPAPRSLTACFPQPGREPETGSRRRRPTGPADSGAGAAGRGHGGDVPPRPRVSSCPSGAEHAGIASGSPAEESGAACRGSRPCRCFSPRPQPAPSLRPAPWRCKRPSEPT